MSRRMKIGLVVGALALIWIIGNPVGAADTAHDGFGQLGTAASNINVFLANAFR